MTRAVDKHLTLNVEIQKVRAAEREKALQVVKYSSGLN